MTKRWTVTPARPTWRQCHGSTLLVTPDGDCLVAYFAGTAEGAPDTGIELVRGIPDGPGSWRWQDPEVVSTAAAPHWNPVLALGPDSAVWLFFKQGSPISRWRTMVRTSADAGLSWSAELELVPGDVGGRGPVKNPPVLLADGTWVAGSSVEAEVDGHPRWDAFADVSTDAGATWQRSADFAVDHTTFPGAGVIQPTVWSTSPSSVTALVRSTAGQAWRTTSVDSGRMWSEPRATDLPNNNSGLCAVALDDGRVACVHNPSAESWGPRNELVVSVSSDDGRRWQRAGVVEALDPDTATRLSPADSGVVTDGSGELSYPTVRVAGEQLLISYTWQRRQIIVAGLPMAGLLATTSSPTR